MSIMMMAMVVMMPMGMIPVRMHMQTVGRITGLLVGMLDGQGGNSQSQRGTNRESPVDQGREKPGCGCPMHT